ncbi:recombinase family protein [Nonomuraea sp. 10N515B]|uniref:recombinase family protein n=1 Tax=Nonomuraea sp. 10N515B TaxID=3457422 RepID=UPI003FCE2F78
MTITFGFYGRVSTEDNQDPQASRAWQLHRARALIEPRGGEIVAEFFDVDKSRSIPWQLRPHAVTLIEELKDPRRGFDAVVIGEPQRAFYGNQYCLTFPLFEHFGVPLWVPEVGGPIDPANEAHDMIMGVFGGLSKGERNGIKIRVWAAMAAITATEGRFLGGRPPYGYTLQNAGPHPNPSKAADGRRLRRLVADPVTSAVVRWIYGECLKGRGYLDIAEDLTRQGILCPSANDPERNKHRDQRAWSKSAVRVILTNPRYTGHQVWNKQRKDEILVDVDNVALGTTTRQRWNSKDKWIWSEHPVHDALVSVEDYRRVQDILAKRSNGRFSHRPRQTRRPYAFRGVLFCGYCERRMQGSWNNEQACYRCRPVARHAIGDDLGHPKVVYLQEAKILDEADGWLATAFGPDALEHTIAAITEQAIGPDEVNLLDLRKRLLKCDRKLIRYRSALDTRGKLLEVFSWHNEAKNESAGLEEEQKAVQVVRPVSDAEVRSVIEEIGDVVRLVGEADPRDKAELFLRLGLKHTYYQSRQTVEARVEPGSPRRRSVCFRAKLHESCTKRSPCSDA